VLGLAYDLPELAEETALSDAIKLKPDLGAIARDLALDLTIGILDHARQPYERSHDETIRVTAPVFDLNGVGISLEDRSILCHISDLPG